jgi:hypothetical protein
VIRVNAAPKQKTLHSSCRFRLYQPTSALRLPKHVRATA